LAGVMFAVLYYFFPKLYFIIPVHVVLNASAVHFGIFQ